MTKTSLLSTETHFKKFREHIIGIDRMIETPCNKSIRLLYTDWTASGRMYAPIEDKFRNEIYPLVANTHTDTNHTGLTMTYAYHKAQKLIKQHVHAGENDIIISSNSGMTGIVNKFQRILGLKLHESFRDKFELPTNERPVVLVSHMEHHSNQTSWYETIAEVVVVPPDENGLISPENFRIMLKKYSKRKIKIAAVTSCSNVTGIITPYMEVAQIMHEEGGLCFVDFAASAPYIDINMHEDDSRGRYLDAIYFSPHKFLGGPGSSGILIFNKKLYKNKVPDNSGGGTVDWTNPWGGHKYIDDIELREDGGTPSFLQTMRVALCCRLKNEMGVREMEQREEEMLEMIWPVFDRLPNVHVLAPEHRKRLPILSFYIDGLHYHAGVKMLNDRFGIQTRGGCSCAGTYGHFLLNVDKEHSRKITEMISSGDCSLKPGWIRMSLHPTQTNEEIEFICQAIEELATHHSEWMEDYELDLTHGRVRHKFNDTTPAMEKRMDDLLLNAQK